MNKVYVIIGVVSGIITSFFLYYYLNNDLYKSREHNLVFRLSTVSVLIISVLFAIIAVKKLNNNSISFMRCMFTGFIISIIGGLVNFAFFTSFYFVSPDIITRAENVSKTQYLSSKEAKKETPERQSQILKGIHTQFTPGGSFLSTIFSSLITCMIASIFIAAFVYTRNNDLQ